MRPIEFRGMTPEGKWVYGDFVRNHSSWDGTICEVGIHVPGEIAYDVDPSTIGQFTGLMDANGTKIWEGDVVSWKRGALSVVADVKFGDGCFRLNGSPFENNHLETGNGIFVIGNIHEGGKP